MRLLDFDLQCLLERGDGQGSHRTRRVRRYVLMQAAETLHRLGYRGLRAKGLKGPHVEALVAEWQRQGSASAISGRPCLAKWSFNVSPRRAWIVVSPSAASRSWRRTSGAKCP